VAPLGNRPAEDLQLALLEFLDPGDQAQEARLAGPVRPDQAAAGARRQVEADIDQGLL